MHKALIQGHWIIKCQNGLKILIEQYISGILFYFFTTFEQ